MPENGIYPFIPLYIINKVYFPFSGNYCPLCIFFIKFPWFFLCNPLPVHGIILPLHSQNGNALLHDWRKRRCAIKERVLWKIFVDRNCSTSAVLYLYMVTDVRNKLVNSLSKVSDFNKKTYRFYAIEDILQWRVWSWLRMNASYRLNTCKSRGSMGIACYVWWRPAHGCVTRIQSARYSGIAFWKED